MKNFGKIQVFIPRSLCSIGKDINLKVNDEGLSAIEISWKNGLVTNIKPLNDKGKSNNQILFPRFVESHAHFDKSFSWVNFPNLKSNYENALSVNLEEHITRTTEKVIKRAEKSLELAINNGYRAIRTHIDTYPSQDEGIWSGIFNLRKKYSEYLELQFVALSPLELWSSENGELIAKKLAKNNGLLGGVLVPPFNKKTTKRLLVNMIRLAEKYSLEVDLHVDESSIEPGVGIKMLLQTIEQLNCEVSITCSHSSSLLLLKDKELSNLGKRISEKNIKIIALPLTNFWLLNRDNENSSLERPVAPVKQLQKAFVDVSIGSDNVQDPWYPFGNFDPFYLMSFAMPMLQLNPWDRLSLSALLIAPSRILKLKWDGIISIGSPADFVIVEGDKWADIFSGNLKRKVLINGRWN